MRTTKLNLRKVTIAGERFFQVVYPILPKGRGRRTFKSKEEAQSFLDLKRIEVRNHGIASSSLTEQQRAEYLDALATLAPLGISLRDAIAVALPHLRARSESCTVTEAVERLLASKRREGRGVRYLGDLSSRLNAFSEVFGKQLVSDLSARQIETWLTGMPVAAQTRNNHRRIVGTLFEYAGRMGWRQGANPALAVPVAKVTRARPAILHAADLKALLDAAAPAILPALAIGALAGLRRAEIERLDWREVKLGRKFIDVGGETAKTGRRRLVPVCESLAAWLTPYAQESGPVAPTIWHYNQLFMAARKAAKLKRGWSGNELRHGYASARLAVTRNAALVAEEMGNSVAIVRSHYAEVLTPEEGTEYFAMSPKAPDNIVNICAA